MTIEEIKKCSDRLAALVADPQPGLFTWHQALHEVITELSTMYTAKVTDQAKKG